MSKDNYPLNTEPMQFRQDKAGPVGGAGELTAAEVTDALIKSRYASGFGTIAGLVNLLNAWLAAKAPQGVDSQTICRKLDAVAQHLNLKGRPQSLDIATAVRLVEEAAEWAAKHIEERGRELDKLRATLNKVAKDIDGTSPNGESIARERIQSVLRETAAPKPAPHPAQMALEHNRSEVAECVTAMKNTLKNYSWLLDGRGSYEWDDDRYRAEFQTVCTAMQKHVEVLARIAADWSNCPEELEDILAARGDRHASAERVRELVAKWRDRVENAPKAFARRPIGDLNRFDALNRFERRMLGWCAGELERALPPSTGEKHE